MPLRQLQGMDTSFVALETPNSPMHIGSILLFDPSTAPGGFVRFKDILQYFESRLQLSSMVRQRLVRVPFDLDYPYWVEDENFDLEFHIRHIALPKPGDWRQLCIQTARIFARPLDLTRPPWEFTVVEGLDNVPNVPPGSFAIVSKVHHAAIDGMSGIDLMEALYTLDPNTPPPNAPDEWKPEKVPSAGELLARSWFNALRNPLERVRVAAQTTPALYRLVQGAASKDFEIGAEMIAPRTRFNVAIGPHRVIEGRSFALADVKAIRALAPGSKVNDVFLAAIGGGLRKYLKAKDDLPDKSLTAMAPISVRSKEEKGDMGNQVAAMVVQLGTHIEDPAERLAYVHDRTKNSKAMTEAIGARNMTEISKISPALYMALGAQLYTRLGLANRINPPFNTQVTNVPGPPVHLYSAGARRESLMGLSCLTDGMGLAHVVQSYVDEATISFTADRDQMPDPEYYIACIAESFGELLAAAWAAHDAATNAAPAKKTGTKPAAGRSKAKSPKKSTKATA